MANHDINMTLERYVQDYANDPEFIAEGLSIKVIEEMLEYLEQRNLSQAWLAQKMGVSRAHISRILNAPPNMTLLTIATIAVALGFTPDVCLNAKSHLPKLSTVGGADTFSVSLTVEYKLAADASGAFVPVAPVSTTAQIGRGQQGALFPTENYNPFRISAEADDLPLVAVMSHSFEEASVGGQRT